MSELVLGKPVSSGTGFCGNASSSHGVRWLATGFLLLLAAGLLCSSCRQEPDPASSEVGFVIDDPSTINDLHRDIGHMQMHQWVELFRPDRCFNGYTLVLYRRAVPVLIDMNGHPVHTWPMVRAIGRARLDHQGRLLIIGRDDLIKEYDWDGNLTWYYQLPRPTDLPHHDLIRLSNGNCLVLAQDTTIKRDLLLEVDRSRRVVWRWSPDDEVLKRFFPEVEHLYQDNTHINSIAELPPNHWYEAGDQRFRPGNILVSARNMNTIFIIDRRTNEVVWRYSGDLDFQHEAVMIGKGRAGAGLIVAFDNGYHNRKAYRRSGVVAIDPVAETQVWRFETDGFFSSVAGTAQPLPNGNVLISSSQGARVFEVTLGKQLVWEWQPTFLPMRAMRYAADHCPQLAALAAQPLSPVVKNDRRPFIDIELYAFNLPEEFRLRTIDGKRYQMMPELEGCRELWLPERAAIDFYYGLDRDKVGEKQLEVRFTATVRPLDEEQPQVLLDDVVSSTDEELWRKIRCRDKRLTYRRVELCTAVEWQGDLDDLHARQAILFGTPRIKSQAIRYNRGRPHVPTAAEEEHEQKQLRAIGYIQ